MWQWLRRLTGTIRPGGGMMTRYVDLLPRISVCVKRPSG